MEGNTINCTEYEENIPKVSKSAENGNLDILGLTGDMTTTENNDKNFTPECTDKLHNCFQDFTAHEIYNRKTGVHDSTIKRESACILPSTHTELPCIMTNIQGDAVERTQVDSDPETSKDSFQAHDNCEQKPACDNTSRNKCNMRNMKSPNFSNVSIPQNSSQYSRLVIVNIDLLKLLSPSSSLPNPPCVIFPTTNLHNTTSKSPINVNNRHKNFAQTTEREEHNLEKELFSVTLLEEIMNETKRDQEHSKKTCKKHVTFSSSLIKATDDSLEHNISKKTGDEILMENINTGLKNDNITDSIIVRFAHGFSSVMAHMCNFAFTKFSSAISEAWEATTTKHKDGYVKYDGPKPRPSLQSHFNRMASKRKLLPSYADKIESEMKIVKRSCRVLLVQSNDSGKLYASSETRFGNS
jgi:hypothetical protein